MQYQSVEFWSAARETKVMTSKHRQEIRNSSIKYFFCGIVHLFYIVSSHPLFVLLGLSLSFLIVEATLTHSYSSVSRKKKLKRSFQLTSFIRYTTSVSQYYPVLFRLPSFCSFLIFISFPWCLYSLQSVLTCLFTIALFCISFDF